MEGKEMRRETLVFQIMKIGNSEVEFCKEEDNDEALIG